MLERQYPIFTLFGFEVKIDLSWIILAILITWTLSGGVFPGMVRGLPVVSYWIMGIVGAVGLFSSIVLHELFHSLVSRRTGLPIKGITLFIFGGVAEMEDEPPDPRSEFLMAGAGPLASILIGGLLFAVDRAGLAAGLPVAVIAVLRYLWYINFILAAFNLIPAFPLDGGRILRSILWKVKGDIRWATKIASWIGSAFGFALIFIGVVNIVRGAFIGGIWWILIGFFVRNASQVAYRRVMLARALHGEPVERFMVRSVTSVPPEATLEEIVNEYIYKYHYKMFPVVEQGRLSGCITTREVKEVPREEWGNRHVSDVLVPCTGENTISPGEDATHALALMNRTGASRLMVVENGTLAGIVTLKDLMKFLSLKLDLESGPGKPGRKRNS